jgi:thiamine biosynthesis protein ThiS
MRFSNVPASHLCVEIFQGFALLLTINGQDKQISSANTLSDLIQELDITAPHFAVALNLQVIPKSQYDSTKLQEGDQVEIVHAVGGG